MTGGLRGTCKPHESRFFVLFFSIFYYAFGHFFCDLFLLFFWIGDMILGSPSPCKTKRHVPPSSHFSPGRQWKTNTQQRELRPVFWQLKPVNRESGVGRPGAREAKSIHGSDWETASSARTRVVANWREFSGLTRHRIPEISHTRRSAEGDLYCYQSECEERKGLFFGRTAYWSTPSGPRDFFFLRTNREAKFKKMGLQSQQSSRHARRWHRPR